MNIWITGANGQLGTALRAKTFPALDEVFFTDVEEVDITDTKAVFAFVELHEIDTIVNCAAYTAVDRAEDEVEKAEKINRDGAANLAKASYALNCLLIHISTDYVFDGVHDTPYVEKDAVNPRTVYGRTKREGERAIIRSGCLHLILRTAWLYSEFGANFFKTILRLAGEREELQVVNDQVGSPTYAGDLADAILCLLATEDLPEHGGIFHYVNEGACTWYEFAREIVALSGKACRVTPVTTAQYPTRAVRPAYSVLDTAKIRATFGLEIPGWQDALRRCSRRVEACQE
ncbi:MAG: dTDP-4-dehydrorhamnose reductase [Odoribacteraceae bacterium]|jgi:dTDP-4-dehydrorhamnose reductase|nr:dTDP-4-dehydrorhamnose reductase [Odoribacteraceae bacterium]